MRTAPCSPASIHAWTDDSAFGARPRADRRGRRRCAVVPEQPRSRAPRRAVGLPALLARRAPQHAGHRERGDVGRHRARRRRARRPSASAPAESCCRTTRRSSSPSSSGRSRRCIRGASISGSAARPAPIRSRPARFAARPRQRDDAFPQDVLELMAYFRPAEPGQVVRAVPGAGLDVPIWILGLEPVRRAARGGARPAVRVRVALRAGD